MSLVALTALALAALPLRSDFDRDGYDDLAIGVPGEDVGSISDAGAVQIAYGSSGGLRAAGQQLLDEDSTGVAGTAGAGDHFGSAVATGDFNGDGYADLAVGAPNDSAVGVANAGIVVVIYGSSSGLNPTSGAFPSRGFAQGSAGLAGTAESGDGFGSSLAAGDFDGDTYDDLAVGVPYEDVGTISDAGAVVILYGSPSGLGTSRSQIFDEDTPDVVGGAQAGDHFGFALAAGDFNCDGKSDLAVGVPDQDRRECDRVMRDMGAVDVLFGSPSGLRGLYSQRLEASLASDLPSAQDRWEVDQATCGLLSDAYFGQALLAGNFGGNACDELVVGEPGFASWGAYDAYSPYLWNEQEGRVHVFERASGYSFQYVVRGEFYPSNNHGIFRGGWAGAYEDYRHYGWALAAHDFDADGVLDLAVGVPGAIPVGQSSTSGAPRIGRVDIIECVMCESTSGTTIQRGYAGFSGTSADGDGFGYALASGRFNYGASGDLVISVPFDDLPIGGVTYVDPGLLYAVSGSSSGLDAAGRQAIRQAGLDAYGDRWAGTLESGDAFGSALTGR